MAVLFDNDHNIGHKRQSVIIVGTDVPARSGSNADPRAAFQTAISIAVHIAALADSLAAEIMKPA